MTETYDRAILQTLQEATTAAVLASTTETLPVAFEAVNFTVPNDQKYLEVVWIPNNNGGDFWGDEKNYRGLFRLVLHWPKDGAGAYAPMDALASILSYFDKGKNLQNVQIYEKPDTGSTVTLENEILYPATIKYQCFRP
jgi:hypothetical protein